MFLETWAASREEWGHQTGEPAVGSNKSVQSIVKNVNDVCVPHKAASLHLINSSEKSHGRNFPDGRGLMKPNSLWLLSAVPGYRAGASVCLQGGHGPRSERRRTGESVHARSCGLSAMKSVYFAFFNIFAWLSHFEQGKEKKKHLVNSDFFSFMLLL